MKKPGEICLLVLACSLCSCSRYYYKPNGVNAPMLSAAKDLHVTANATNDGSFVNLQAAYSPVNHVGIIANYSTYSYKATDADAPSGNVDAAAHLGELGAGYYYMTNSKIKVIYDIYGGIGFGAMRSDIDMKAYRPFIQPGIGFKTSIFEFSFNYRLCDVKYYNLNTNGHDNDYLKQQKLLDDNGKRIDDRHYIFAEPAVTLRAGYKFIKLQAQYVITSPISKVAWAYSKDQFNLGANFELEELISFVKTRKQKAAH